MALVNPALLDLNINTPKLNKIEKMFGDSSYSELIEFSANFNTRLSIERKLRMPFLDPQTGVAQNHSNLFMKKSQRIPGLRSGQVYTYPSSRWRTTRKRQYLTNANAYPFNYRPFGRFHQQHPEFEIPHVQNEFIPAEEPVFRPMMAEDSKDSHKDDGSKSGWYYDEMDMHDMDNFDEDDDNSDDDFIEPRSGRKKRSSRTPGSSKRKEKDSEGRRRSSGNRGRGGRKVNPPPMDNSSNSSDKFNDYSRRRSGNPPQVTTIQHANPMSFDEAIPEHKIMTTDRGRMNFEDISQASTSGGTLSSILGSPSKPSVDRNEKPRANPSTYCDFCLGDAKENKKTGTSEELVSCSDCGRSGHPTCLQFTENMIISVKKYRWQCIECKCCSICGTSENDERLLFCDSCDAGKLNVNFYL